MPCRPRAAFTLIELLIVVAIIAILAAIALPNFLEAQTRAKVSRVKSDIHALATAMEAYSSDNNHYPFCDPHMDHAYLSDIPQLTTPISYMTALPYDAFPPQASAEREKFYRYYPVDYWAQVFPQLQLRNWKWIVMSNGPDRRIDISQDNAQEAIDGHYTMVYDPTNGTTSRGDIWATNQGLTGGHS